MISIAKRALKRFAYEISPLNYETGDLTMTVFLKTDIPKIGTGQEIPGVWMTFPGYREPSQFEALKLSDMYFEAFGTQPWERTYNL